VSFDNNNLSTSALRPTCHFSSKYEKWYWSIIHKAQKRLSQGEDQFREPVEEHHPIPECMWANNWIHSDRFWKVVLTPREHYVVHLLLAKMELTPYIARSITRFLNSPHHHLKCSYTKLDWLGKKIVSKHGYNVPPYRNHATSLSRSAKDLWLLAEDAYLVWKKLNCGGKKIATELNARDSSSFHSMVKKFKEGWVPSKDADWVSFTQGR
jgi:hypothetical protein